MTTTPPDVPAPAAADVIYRGVKPATGAAVVTLHSLDGALLGALHHVARNSLRGMDWGGPGPAATDLARSLLIDALGEQPVCLTCHGSYEIAYDLDGPAPYTARAAVPRDHDPTTPDRTLIDDCPFCDERWRGLPDQDFQFAYVITWGDTFEIRRSEVLAWLAAHGWTP